MGRIVVFVLIGLVCTDQLCRGGEADCCSVTATWVQAVGKNSDVLRFHVQSACRFSHDWIRTEEAGNSSRERVCNDLVLVWAHKECVYFRDYVCHDVYDPCKAWTRKMFRQCMAGNIMWFDCRESVSGRR